MHLGTYLLTLYSAPSTLQCMAGDNCTKNKMAVEMDLVYLWHFGVLETTPRPAMALPIRSVVGTNDL